MHALGEGFWAHALCARRAKLRRMSPGSEKIVHVHGVDLCTETFGDTGDPPVLLIMGAMASMDWWPAQFCRNLAAQRRFIIRYDHRDTGRSTAYPLGAPGYDLEDLAEDAVGVLDAKLLRPCLNSSGAATTSRCQSGFPVARS